MRGHFSLLSLRESMQANGGGAFYTESPLGRQPTRPPSGIEALEKNTVERTQAKAIYKTLKHVSRFVVFD